MLMKREIKYKARCIVDGIEQDMTFEIKHMDEYLSPFRQYTGLKDKNGKEIYEGDILTYDERIRGFVKYIGCSFIIEWVGIDTYSDLLGWDNWRSGKTSDGSKYEVIGNIYQNPELLNQ